MTAEISVILIATFLGVLTATLWPYFRKLWEGKIDKFDWKYFWHLVGTAAWTFLLDIATYSQWVAPAEFAFNDVLVYILAFTFGFGGNEAQKEMEKFLRYLWGMRQTEAVLLDQ